MNIKRIISLGTLVSFIFTILTFTVIYFQDDINAIFVQFGLFMVFVSTLFFANFALFEFSVSTSLKIKRSLSITNFILSAISGLVFFDFIPFSSSWHILVGLGIVYLLTVQLQLLGWSGSRHSLLDKIIFTIVLVSNIFLAAIFIFRLDYFQLEALTYVAVAIAILSLLYGLYFKGIKTIDNEKQKV